MNKGEDEAKAALSNAQEELAAAMASKACVFVMKMVGFLNGSPCWQ